MFFLALWSSEKQVQEIQLKKYKKNKETNISMQNNMIVKHHQDTKLWRMIFLKQKDKSQGWP